MTKREFALQKLHKIPDSEVLEAVKQLTCFVSARLRLGSLGDRTKTGAHSSKNLGTDAVEYYVSESIRRLYDPKGWEWKYEKFSLSEQLIRIANHLIWWEINKYKKAAEFQPEFDNRDAGDIYELDEIDCQSDANDDAIKELTAISFEVTKDNDNLSYFTMRYFENADFGTIASEMGLNVEQVYVLRKKLVRRLMPFKNKLKD